MHPLTFHFRTSREDRNRPRTSRDAKAAVLDRCVSGLLPVSPVLFLIVPQPNNGNGGGNYAVTTIRGSPPGQGQGQRQSPQQTTMRGGNGVRSSPNPLPRKYSCGCFRSFFKPWKLSFLVESSRLRYQYYFRKAALDINIAQLSFGQ
jgi:hypothetical protein